MKIKLTSIIVDNQDKALKFYTEVLGFVKSKDIPANSDGSGCLAGGSSGCRAFTRAERQSGCQDIPGGIIQARDTPDCIRGHDMQKEFQRLKAHGVVFSQEPVKTAPVMVAIFSDTCGNLIQIYQPPSVP